MSLVFGFLLVASGCGATLSETALGSAENSQSLANIETNFATQVDSLSFKVTSLSIVSADLSISINVDGTARAVEIDSDPLCTKQKEISSAELEHLVVLIRSLQFDFSQGPVAAGADTELLTISGRAGERLAIHLLDGDVPRNQFVAQNGAMLAAALRNVQQNLVRVCQ